MKADGAAVAIRVWPLERAESAPLEAAEVSVAPGVLARVWGHARSRLDREVGGVLVGDLLFEGATARVGVVGHIAAEDVEAGPAHLIFTHRSWQHIRVRRLAEYPDISVVGWYHTHPGIGVFMSPADCALHERIFRASPGGVALVLDPLSNTHAFFWVGAAGVAPCAEVVAGAGQPTRGAREERDHGVPDPKRAF